MCLHHLPPSAALCWVPLPIVFLSLGRHCGSFSKRVSSEVSCPLCTPTLQCQDKQVRILIFNEYYLWGMWEKEAMYCDSQYVTTLYICTHLNVAFGLYPQVQLPWTQGSSALASTLQVSPDTCISQGSGAIHSSIHPWNKHQFPSLCESPCWKLKA